jgi:hypothetical protein
MNTEGNDMNKHVIPIALLFGGGFLFWFLDRRDDAASVVLEDGRTVRPDSAAHATAALSTSRPSFSARNPFFTLGNPSDSVSYQAVPYTQIVEDGRRAYYTYACARSRALRKRRRQRHERAVNRCVATVVSRGGTRDIAREICNMPCYQCDVRGRRYRRLPANVCREFT